MLHNIKILLLKTSLKDVLMTRWSHWYWVRTLLRSWPGGTSTVETGPWQLRRSAGHRWGEGCGRVSGCHAGQTHMLAPLSNLSNSDTKILEAENISPSSNYHGWHAVNTSPSCSSMRKVWVTVISIHPSNTLPNLSQLIHARIWLCKYLFTVSWKMVKHWWAAHTCTVDIVVVKKPAFVCAPKLFFLINTCWKASRSDDLFDGKIK